MSNPFSRRLVPLQLVVFCLTFASGTRAAEPVWALLGPGSGPRQFRFLTVDPQDGRVVYAGGPEGIYRSADRGNTWKRLGGGLGALSVATDLLNSQVLFAGDKGSLYKSADGGQTWSQVHGGVGMEAVAVSPWDDQLVLAGGWQGIYHSTDLGGTWQQVKEGVRLNVLVFDPRDPEMVYAACIEGLYRSSDLGLSWEKLCEGNFTQLLIDPRDHQIMNAIAEINQKTAAYRSTDGGKTWMRGGDAPWGTYYNTLAMDSSNPSVLYLTAGSALFRSADNGIYWERLGPGPLLLAVDSQDSRFIYGGTEEWGNDGTLIWTHFVRSSDGGNTWQEVPLHTPVFAAAIDSQDPQTLYISTDQGGFRSGDGGQQWALADTGHIFATLLVDPRTPRSLYGGGQQGLFRSEDQGTTWVQLSDLGGRSASSLVADIRQTPATLYVIAGEQLFQSEDQGATWLQVDGNLGDASMRSLVLSPQDEQTLYIGTSDGVFKSDDRGKRWTRVTVSIGIGAMAIGAQPPYTIYASVSGDPRLYISEDTGRSWSLTNPLPHRKSEIGVSLSSSILNVVTDPQDSRVLYAATEQAGVYRSLDGGATWEFFNTGLPLFRGGGFSSRHYAYQNYFSRIPRLVLPASSPYLLYVATDWGLYRFDLPSPPEPGREGEDTIKTPEEKWASTGPSALLYGEFHLGIAVSTLAVDPQDARRLYAGTSTGQIFKRTPDGAWSKSSVGLPGTAVLALAVDPQDGQRIYAGVEGQPALYYTQDGGQNWWPASSNSLFGSVYAVAFHPTDPQTIYGTMNTVLVRSRNGGGTWEKVLTGPAQFSSVAIDPQDPKTLYVGARDPYPESGLYKSEDDGHHWQRVMEGRVSEVVINPHDSHSIYALAEGTVRKSPDRGQTWQDLDTHLLGAPLEALTFDPRQNGQLYLAVGNRVFKSSDSGETWTDLQAGLPNTAIYTLVVGTGETPSLLVATGHGVFSNEGLEDPALDQEAILPPSEIGADSVWTSAGLESSVHELVIAPSDPHVIYVVAGGSTKGTYQDGDLYQKGVDGSWTRVQSGGISGFLVISPQDPSVMYTSRRGGGVSKSEDGAKSWHLAKDWNAGGDAAVIDPHNPQVIYVGGYGFVLKSTDGGNSWDSGSGDNYYHFVSFAIDRHLPQMVYAASDGSAFRGLYKSIDGGANWPILLHGTARNVALDWKDSQQVYALIDSALYHSDDAGKHWFQLAVDAGKEPLSTLALDWQNSGTLYVAARGKVFRSTDYGTNWKKICIGLPDTTISVLAVDPLDSRLVYAGTDKGLYNLVSGNSMPTDTIPAPVGSVGVDSRLLPATTSLGQNFPNPFNLQTTIPYQLATNSIVRLEIFDLRGRRIRVLRQGLQPPGFYRPVWDGRDEQGQEVGSGVYLVRLQVGSFAAVRKVLLVK